MPEGGRAMRILKRLFASAVALAAVVAVMLVGAVVFNGTVSAVTGGTSASADPASANANRLLVEGRRVFRFDTFGSEAVWGGVLGLHKAIAGAKNGGVGA